MLIFDCLKEDHNIVRGLLERADNIINNFPEINKDEFDDLIEEIKDELGLHNKIEEEIFYNFLKKKSKNSILPYSSFEEHQLAMEVLKDLENNKLDNQVRVAKLLTLKKIVLQHIEEEESHAFDYAMKCLNSTEQEELGTKFEQRKKDEEN